MRQYKIYRRTFVRGTAEMSPWMQMWPFVMSAYYDRPEIWKAVSVMCECPYIEGVALRIGDEQFNIVAFEQPAEAPHAFRFGATYHSVETVGGDDA